MDDRIEIECAKHQETIDYADELEMRHAELIGELGHKLRWYEAAYEYMRRDLRRTKDNLVSLDVTYRATVSGYESAVFEARRLAEKWRDAAIRADGEYGDQPLPWEVEK